MALFFKKKSASEDTVAAIAMGDAPVLAAESQQTKKKFARAIWWVEHRDQVIRAGVIALAVAEVMIGIVGAWKFVDYYVFDYVEEQRLVETFFVGAGDLAAAAQTQAPLEVVLSIATALKAGDTYDLLAFVENPNAAWVARVTYQFVYGDAASASQSVTVLQGETAPLVAFDIGGDRPFNPRVEIETVEWYRIRAQDIPVPMAWKEERLNLVASAIEHDDNARIGDKVFGRTSFELKNESGYGYWEVELFVVLRRGSAPVAVHRTTLTNILPRELRAVQLSWFDAAPRAGTVDLYPRVNLFDASVYRPESVPDTLDVRDALRRR